MVRPWGRPLKFETPEKLQTKIDEYFESIKDEHWVRKKVVEFENDKYGNPVEVEKDKWEPVYDRNGNIEIIFKEQPTITGLAVFLGTSRKILMEYEDEHEGFRNTVKAAKAKIEYYYEQAEDAPALKIFKLKNFDWTDKQEIKTDQSINANVTAKIGSLDLDDRINGLIEDKLSAALQ